MIFNKNKMILILVLISVAILCFIGGFQIGVQSKASSKVVSNKTLDELLPELKNCISDYGNATRVWDCSASSNQTKRRCAISLTVKSGNTGNGAVYLDGLLIETKYKVDGLIQSWIFDNGSSFSLEPSGKGEYKKSQTKTSPFNFFNYTCSVVKT